MKQAETRWEQHVGKYHVAVRPMFPRSQNQRKLPQLKKTCVCDASREPGKSQILVEFMPTSCLPPDRKLLTGLLTHTHTHFFPGGKNFQYK